MNAVLVVDKPAGMTSHDVVARVRRITGERAVGHLGTLDPAATGVLPLVIGKLTRLAQFYTGAEKSYEGEIRFGFATDTYDAQGAPTSPAQPVTLDPAAIQRAAQQFLGKLIQTPPPFSAKKIAGVPAYKLARRQKEVKVKPVEVWVKQLEILSVNGDRARFRALVSAGTYLRSIAHDLGQAMGPGAHLANLHRASLGEFTQEHAHSLEEIERAKGKDRLAELFVHPRLLLPELPAVAANEEAVARLSHGNAVNLPELSKARLVKVFRGQGELIAIAQRVAGTLFHPKVVMI